MKLREKIECMGVVVSGSEEQFQGIPQWAVGLVQLGSLLVDERARGRASLVVLVLPSRRLAGPLISLGISIQAALTSSDAMEYKNGDQVYWIEGRRVRRGIFRGFWADPRWEGMPMIEQSAKGGDAMIGKSRWQLFPGVPRGQRDNLDMFDAVEPFRQRCKYLAAPRKEIVVRNVLLGSRDVLFAEADSVIVKCDEDRATLRQLLLWGQGNDIGQSNLLPAGSERIEEFYDKIKVAVLDGPQAIHHLERDDSGNKLMSTDTSCVLLLDEVEFSQCDAQLQTIAEAWGGTPLDKDDLFEEVCMNLSGAGIMHHVMNRHGENE